MLSKNTLFFVFKNRKLKIKNKKSFWVAKHVFLFFYFKEYKIVLENSYQIGSS